MDPRDRDIIARTIVGEAANQPFEGQQAVANVILNRLRSGKFGGSISDVVFAPYQFEPWRTRKDELLAIPQDSPAYQRALQAIEAANGADATGGATHFLEPNIVRQRRGGTLPKWAVGQTAQIGNHLFFNPGGGGPTKATSPTNAAPYSPTVQPVPPAAAVQKPSSVADVLALMAADNSSQVPLTPLANAAQIGPLGGASDDEEIDPAIFQPRRARTTRQKPQRA